MRHCVVVVCVVALLLSFQPSVQAQMDLKVNILAVDTSRFPEIGIDFQVQDASGRRVEGVDERSVQVLEDAASSHAPINFSAQIADATAPTRKVKLVAPNPQNQAEVDIFATGAAIGVVFDNSSLLNVGAAGGHDYLAEGRRAIEQFLLQPSKAPSNPEQISLFLPISSPEQQAQPSEFMQYTSDRNAVINYLRTTTPRTGKTNLYAAVQEAVIDTAAAAHQGGREALVLVVGDGGDEISADTFASIIRDAKTNNVKIIAFGVGTDTALIKQRGGFQLNQLATASSGVYLQRPDDANSAAAFQQHTPVASDTLYTVRYKTTLLDDGKPHSFVVQVRSGDGTAISQPVMFHATNGQVVALRPLAGVLLRDYFALSVPTALVLSLLLVLVTGGARWRQSRSISRAQTMR